MAESPVIDFLLTRRSVAIPALRAPGPDAEIETIIDVASRVPDHGKLAPWRFILYRGDAAVAIGEALAALAETREGPLSELRRERGASASRAPPLVIGVVSTAGPHVKIPEWEQVPLGRRRGDEPHPCRPRAGLCRQLGDRMGTPTTRRPRRSSASAPRRRPSASSTSARRESRRRTGRGRRLADIVTEASRRPGAG